MFTAKKWSWKRVVANLLLVPVLTGGTVAIVHAQFNKDKPAKPTASKAAPARPANGDAAGGESSRLLKEGRKALAEGRYADARDLAMAAEANNPAGKWGLFDDTPTALRKDILYSQAKANKSQADQLVKQAKALATKPAENDAERAYNLDGALQMARKANQLHGPYSVWEIGTRADKLVKELEASRGQLKVTPSNPNTNAVASGDTTPTQRTNPERTIPERINPEPPNDPPPTVNTAIPTDANVVPAAATDTRKQRATKLVAEGQYLADQQDYFSAKAKFVEADKIGASFDADEFSPSFALRQLNVRGEEAIEKLIQDAQAFAAKKDFARANTALSNAADVAATLGLFSGPVTQARNALWTASGGRFGVAQAGIPTAMPERPETRDPYNGGATVTANPVNPPAPAQTVYVKPVEPKLTPSMPRGGNITGRQLLDQAAYEFKRGELDTAQRLALQAHNLGGVAEEAQGLLNSIDAERLNKKQRVAMNSLENAKIAFNNKEYQHTMGVLVLIDPNLLTEDAKRARSTMLATCNAELNKPATGTGLVVSGGTQPPERPVDQPKTVPTPPPGMATVNPPGMATVNTPTMPTVKADTPIAQPDAMKRVEFQKLRSQGLKVQGDAQAAFGRGDTDIAMQMLIDYSNRVRASGIEPSQIAQLLRPIDGRLDTFRLMKGQIDATMRQTRANRDAKDLVVGRGVLEEERKKEVALLLRQYRDLLTKRDYAAAERVAMQAKQLDPDDPAVSALADVAKLQRRVKEAEQDKLDKEQFVFDGLRNAEYQGPMVTTEDPVAVRLEAMRRNRNRTSGDGFHQPMRSPAGYDIELKMQKPISIEFRQTPLDQAIEQLQTLTGLPILIDKRALQAEGISEVQLTDFKVGTSLAAKNVLACILEPAGLGYVVEDDVVKVTTKKKTTGRLVTKVFSVADLVTPVPNFALPDYANFDKMINKTPLSSGALALQGVTPGLGGATPFSPAGGLGGGQPAGTMATSPGIQAPQFGSGGSLQTNPLGASSNVVNGNNSKHEQLIKLITSMVRTYSWEGHGGSGKVEFFDTGSALVVNQTADVINEVNDLLEALRRLQDLSIAVEIRIVSLSEAFFERMGLDFSVNIKTDATSFEPSLTSGNFRPAPYINDINNKGVTVGLTPAGTFTPDLDVPIRGTSFNRAIPGFGNFPNSPGNNGGLSLGLAFLNDIQVFTFLEMAQGDQRANIMLAPKLTMFNGQTATLSVNNTEFYVTSVQVVSVNGQIVFIPNNTALPGPGDFATPGASGPPGSINISVQAVVSADRRFVRLNLPVNLAAQSGAAVPLFPITTFITPVFEGGSQGQPIPFTQFLQQPAFTNLNIQTTVVCPDGGTVLLGGLKALRESRNELGPPFLSKIPYLNRLFKNVGVGRDTRHIMIMVTPRIIITAEEEIIQTEGRLPQGN